jgi:oligopeptidase B
MGWVVALAHCRGGGEGGDEWHEMGRGLAKENTVLDLEASVRLVQERLALSNPARSAVMAWSAGAVPAVAVAQRNPELVRAIALESPFLDVLGALLDKSAAINVHDEGEWGDPEASAEAFRVIRALSPYENVRAGRFPSLFATVALSDARVPFSRHGLKFFARLRHRAPETRAFLHARLGGHEAGGRLGTVMSDAAKLGFLFHELGLASPQNARPAP